MNVVSTKNPNPYDPPQSYGVNESPSRQVEVSIIRGVGWAIPAAFLGFVIPFVVLGAIPLIRVTFFEYPEIDNDDDLRALPSQAIAAAVACSILFALSAILNFTPRYRIGFIRSLAIVGGIGLVTLIIVGTVVSALGVNTRSHRDEPNPYALLCCGLVILGVVACTCVILFVVISRQSKTDS